MEVRRPNLRTQTSTEIHGIGAPPRSANRWRRWAGLALALVFLDVSLTFQNVWPTPAIRWNGELSLDLAACLLVLVALSRWARPPSRALMSGLSAFWVVLVIGRYAQVTAPALYGRDINLYWDLQFVPDVAALLARAAPLWLVAAVVVTAALLLVALYKLLRLALGRVGAAMADAGERRAVGALAAAALILFAGQRLIAQAPRVPAFSTPVTETYAEQIRLVAEARSGSKLLAASPPMNSNLSRVRGADVYLIFVESYGAITYDRPELEERLRVDRARFDLAIHDTGREVVSAFVESPTFGGSSWLAHISLMSGIQVRDAETNALLMTQKRDTLPTAFERHGYRTVALMPGLWQSWPEGAFYGFNEIYGGARLDYQGPKFGWFSIPDQFAMAKFDALEINRPSRPPFFVFFPTISTHTPFSPTPPYQPDWRRVLTPHPYDRADLDRAYAHDADWLNLGPSYADAMSYAFATLGGYLRVHADRDFVMILIGDHQPPALVSGEGAPWDVPVHVIASRRDVLDRLLPHGFRAGAHSRAPESRPHERAAARAARRVRRSRDARRDALTGDRIAKPHGRRSGARKSALQLLDMPTNPAHPLRVRQPRNRVCRTQEGCMRYRSLVSVGALAVTMAVALTTVPLAGQSRPATAPAAPKGARADRPRGESRTCRASGRTSTRFRSSGPRNTRIASSSPTPKSPSWTSSARPSRAATTAPSAAARRTSPAPTTPSSSRSSTPAGARRWSPIRRTEAFLRRRRNFRSGRSVDRDFALALLAPTEPCKLQLQGCAGGKYGPPSPRRNEVPPSYLHQRHQPQFQPRGPQPRRAVPARPALPEFGSAFGGSYRRIVQTPGGDHHLLRPGPGPGVPAQHRDERQPAPAVEHPPVVGRLARPLGRQHAGHRRHQFLREARLPGLARKPAPRRTLDADSTPTTLDYVVTIEDPTMWTKPWTVKQEFTAQHNEANRIYYEPRCHEGNFGLPGMLMGARSEETAFAEGRGVDPATKCTAACTFGPSEETADPLQ